MLNSQEISEQGAASTYRPTAWIYGSNDNLADSEQGGQWFLKGDRHNRKLRIPSHDTVNMVRSLGRMGPTSSTDAKSRNRKFWRLILDLLHACCGFFTFCVPGCLEGVVSCIIQRSRCLSPSSSDY